MKLRLLTIALLAAVLLLNAGFRAFEQHKVAILRHAMNAILQSIDDPPPATAAKPPSRARCHT